MASTWYVDLNNGNDSNNGTSFAQRVKTLSKASSFTSAGDTVRIMGNAPTNVRHRHLDQRLAVSYSFSIEHTSLFISTATGPPRPTSLARR